MQTDATGSRDTSAWQTTRDRSMAATVEMGRQQAGKRRSRVYPVQRSVRVDQSKHQIAVNMEKKSLQVSHTLGRCQTSQGFQCLLTKKTLNKRPHPNDKTANPNQNSSPKREQNKLSRLSLSRSFAAGPGQPSEREIGRDSREASHRERTIRCPIKRRTQARETVKGEPILREIEDVTCGVSLQEAHTWLASVFIRQDTRRERSLVRTKLSSLLQTVMLGRSPRKPTQGICGQTRLCSLVRASKLCPRLLNQRHPETSTFGTGESEFAW